ncbi:MAG: hypothetical protein AAF399_04785 [Bacteroidota bacterium]
MNSWQSGWLLILFLIPQILLSQNRDSLRSGEAATQAIEQAIEDLILNAEVEDQVDYTDWIDQLESWSRRPLNLNEASPEELKLLPGLNDLMVFRLQSYLRTFGKLTTIYELQAVPGWTLDDIRPILPFVMVADSRSLDINPGVKHPRGPGAREIWQGLEGEWLQRMTQVLEEQRGYTPPDTIFREKLDDNDRPIGQDTLLNTRYLGDPRRHYTRIRFRYKQHLSAGIVGEKDPGEAFGWKPDQRKYGYDYLSAHFFLKDFGRLKRLAIGDYFLSFGQGMVLSRGIGFGKGLEAVRGVKQPELGVRPYASVNENQFLRGAAATYAFGDIELTGFFSRARLDASIQEVDTLTGEALLAGSLQTSGLHRTPSELFNRRSVRETLYGGRIAYRSRSLQVGVNQVFQQFSGNLEQNLNAYNQFNFRGDENRITSLDFDWVVQNFNLFGEVARSQSGGTGAILGMMGSVSSVVDVALQARRFTPDFHSQKAYVFAERPAAASNESGLYLGLRIAPNPRWTLQTYFDQFYFPWNRFRTFFPSKGWEYFSQLTYKPKRGTEVYVRFRTDNKERNATIYEAGQQVAYLVPTRKNQLRFQFQTRPHRDILYRTRLEGAWYVQGEEEQHQGWLMYQDLVWKIGFKHKLTGRYAIFDVSDYEARIYAYENDILGFFTIPPYSGRGSRFYLMYDWKISRNLELWVRVSQTRLREICQDDFPRFELPAVGSVYQSCAIGSGLERIERDTRTDLRVQLRIRF